MRQQRVALHLAEADAAAGLAPLDRLAGERVDGPDGAHLELVGDLVGICFCFFSREREKERERERERKAFFEVSFFLLMMNKKTKGLRTIVK